MSAAIEEPNAKSVSEKTPAKVSPRET